jgi:uncharacterized protein
MSPSWTRHLPDLACLFLAFSALSILTYLALSRSRGQTSARRRFIIAAAGTATVILALGVALTPYSVRVSWPRMSAVWIRAISLALAGCAIATAPVALFWTVTPRRLARFDPERRRLLMLARTATIVAPAALGAFAVLRRNDLRLNETEIRIPGLHPDLHGLRIVQLSDIHMSPFLSRAELDRAVARANETRPHIALVTGDLITDHRDPLDQCLDSLRRLKSDAGTFGCLGNHEVYAGSELYTTVQGARLGMRFLRSEAQALPFGKAWLNLAGVDYQRFHRSYLAGAEALLGPAMLNVLLSHNPDVFNVAADQGWDVTIAGHTHGGQINVEILSTSLNVMRFYTPYTYGLYTEGPSSIFVTRGIGTVGVPARLGAPSEVALIRLAKA